MRAEKGGVAECGRSDPVEILGDLGCFDAPVGKIHRRGPAMKMIHTHETKAGCRIGYGLGIAANAGNHVEKCFDIVADGFKTFDLCRCQAGVITQLTARAAGIRKIDDLTHFALRSFVGAAHHFALNRCGAP